MPSTHRVTGLSLFLGGTTLENGFYDLNEVQDIPQKWKVDRDSSVFVGFVADSAAFHDTMISSRAGFVFASTGFVEGREPIAARHEHNNDGTHRLTIYRQETEIPRRYSAVRLDDPAGFTIQSSKLTQEARDQLFTEIPLLRMLRYEGGQLDQSVFRWSEADGSEKSIQVVAPDNAQVNIRADGAELSDVALSTGGEGAGKGGHNRRMVALLKDLQ